MRLAKGIKEVIRNPRKYMVTIVLGVLVILLGMFTIRSAGSRKELSYTECLDQTAVTVNGQKVTFREAALYVAYEEQSVQAEDHKRDDLPDVHGTLLLHAQPS